VSDEQNQPRGGVRRVGRKDQKKHLSSPDSLFPLEDFISEEDLATEANTLSLTREDRTSTEETRPHQAESVDLSRSPAETPLRVMDFAPPVVAPSHDERFPPINPLLPEKPKPPAPPVTSRRRFTRHDVIALLFALGTIGLCAYFSLLWVDPYSALNPLAPPTPLPIVITATPQGDSAVQAVIETVDVTATFTPFLNIVLTEELEAPTLSPFPFVLAESGIMYMPNANGNACNWSSIAGTVTDNSGQALNGYRVRVTSPNDPNFEEAVFSGSTLTFGAGGFELPLGGAPQAAAYIVRLFDLAGAPVSDEYAVSTRAECEANVVLVNFIEAR
jgi:hypothetical protein